MAPKSLSSPSAMKFGLISAIFAAVAMAGAGALSDAAAAKTAKHKAASAKPAAKAEAPTPHGLVGLLHAGPDRVKVRLGDPAIARAEGKGAFWTYRAPHCALYVFFKDEGAGLKVSGAAAGPRKHGAPYPELDACIADLEQAAPPAP